MKHFLKLLIVGAFFTSSIESEAAITYRIVWKEDFTQPEKTKIESWLKTCTEAVERSIGSYPFTVTYYLSRKDNASEPVPWANTVRSGEQAVEFYVDPSYDLSEFLADWTAPHEISHLSIPYVGRSNMWFSEGYASYMQYLVLTEMGMCTMADAKTRIQDRVENIVSDFERKETMPEAVDRLKRHHNYPAIYWGGACFFIQADKRLRQELGTSLTQVIAEYQTTSRLVDDDLDSLIASLDKQTDSQIFSELHLKFTSEPATEVITMKNFE